MDVAVKQTPSLRSVSGEQWLAFGATMSGWILDAFDYNILAIILIDIQKSFTIDSTLAGLLPTATLVMRLIGGVSAGAAADKWGRKFPLMLSILWFSLFAFFSGFSNSYTMLFGLRALFGTGPPGCAGSFRDFCSADGIGAICSRRWPFNSSSPSSPATSRGDRCSGSPFSPGC
jgi:MFS family permease